MNLSTDNTPPMGRNAGAVPELGPAHAAPAHPGYTAGAVGFGPSWTVEDSMAASIVRLEQENQELQAEVALLREQAAIMQRTIESLRDQRCADKCRDKAAADGGWANI